MPIANIKEFRAELDRALAEAGFALTRNGRNAPERWSLPGAEVVPAFFPHAIRQWWGFTLSGSIGFDLAGLRVWLNARFKREELGIFRLGFVSMHIANYPDIGSFRRTLDDEIPMVEWVGQIKERLTELPRTLDEIVDAYRKTPHRLLRMDDRFNKPAWDFLLDWYPQRDTARPVPQNLF
jgi:hypothetical protein